MALTACRALATNESRKSAAAHHARKLARNLLPFEIAERLSDMGWARLSGLGEIERQGASMAATTARQVGGR